MLSVCPADAPDSLCKYQLLPACLFQRKKKNSNTIGETISLTWNVILLLLVDSAGEGVSQDDGGEEHLHADDEVLPAGRHRAGADFMPVDIERVGNDAAAFQDGEDHALNGPQMNIGSLLGFESDSSVWDFTLPEGQEDDGLDREELEHGLVWPEEVAGGEEEEEEGVERQADGEVVDDGDVQVAPVDAAEKTT